MPQSLAKVLVQIVFSTKHRYPGLSAVQAFLAERNIRNQMHAY